MDRSADLLAELERFFPKERLRTKLIDLITYASDAGFYTLRPKVIVLPVSEDEIIKLFEISQKVKVPIVFRTGGTSLSGQAITDGILVDLSQNWRNISIEDGGKLVRVQPGITGALVNAHLKKYQVKIGPDPASINAAMIGGILSNNASGMCCGVAQNSYHTTKHIRFILPDGEVYTTENKDDYTRFAETDLGREILALKIAVRENPALLAKIKNKYLTKTTIGYSLNAFADYDAPLDVFAHLLIGAEGTLAFIAEAVLETVPDYPFKATAMMYFDAIKDACEAIIPLTLMGAMTVELMDSRSLHAVSSSDVIYKNLGPNTTALLVEFQENSMEALSQKVEDYEKHSHTFRTIAPVEFTTKADIQAAYWKIRKGLFPTVGAVRKSGTTVVLEDVAFPVEVLADALSDLQVLFSKYNYQEAIMFGHAKDGNIHFVVTQSFESDKEVARYADFMEDVVELVVNKYNGTLKGEHGTGRNMAPFVQTEWGEEAYQIMARLKKVADPEGLLNPGVIINPDDKIHLKNFKNLPTVEEEVDKCTECGFCEPLCPSRDITTSPRRRIVARRALQSLKNTKDYDVLLEEYQYHGSDTCAVDGLCATACPVNINTGDLTKRLRKENHSASANAMAKFVGRNFGLTIGSLRLLLKTGNKINKVFGEKTMWHLTKGMNKMFKGLPVWVEVKVPELDVLKQQQGNDQADIIYFPSCISRLMGAYPGQQKNLMEVFFSVCKKTNIQVQVVDNYASACCSQIFGSKGFHQAYQEKANEIIEALWLQSKGGLIPVVVDVSSCSYTLKQLKPVLSKENQTRFNLLVISDVVEWLNDAVLTKIKPNQLDKSVSLHPVCSLKKMNVESKLISVAQMCAKDVHVPYSAGCCGMAGDRGFLYPELTLAATKNEAAEVRQTRYDGYYSSTSTCEWNLSQATNQNYESILYLVDEALGGE
ncbi:MAG: FAD-binding oxidoreductase [Saprospiraceae bacterium]|nr:FAD-binding oxidoreductase [Saprospiraceae bacterium]